MFGAHHVVISHVLKNFCRLGAAVGVVLEAPPDHMHPVRRAVEVRWHVFLQNFKKVALSMRSFEVFRRPEQFMDFSLGNEVVKENPHGPGIHA